MVFLVPSDQEERRKGDEQWMRLSRASCRNIAHHYGQRLRCINTPPVQPRGRKEYQKKRGEKKKLKDNQENKRRRLEIHGIVFKQNEKGSTDYTHHTKLNIDWRGTAYYARSSFHSLRGHFSFNLVNFPPPLPAACRPAGSSSGSSSSSSSSSGIIYRSS